MLKYLLTLMVIILLFGCNKDKQAAIVPVYLNVDDISISTNYTTQGSNSDDITDAWIYIDANFVIAKELPAVIPINKLGSHTLTIRPGIKVNGITNARAYYRFYAPFDTVINFKSGQEIHISPKLSYAANTVFEFMEDFESAGINFSYPSNSEVNVVKSSTNAFEKNYSGLIQLSSSQNYFEARTPVLSLPTDGTDVFMEINANTNDLIEVGIYADDTKVPMYYINVTNGDWKKIYFSFQDALQQYPNKSIKVYFAITRDTNPDDDGRTSPDNIEAYLDNIKILHF